MLGDGAVDVLDGVVGDLKLVAVCVDELAEWLDLHVVAHLGHRGERGG